MAHALDDMRPEHLDVLKEIGNIGSGNATTSLASMLGRSMRMNVPKASLVPFDHIADILGGPENIVVGVLVNMDEDLKGFVLLVLELSDAFKMASLLTGDDIPDTQDITGLSEMEISALTEISNILVGSYLSAISTLADLRIRPSVPQICIDMAGAIMSVPAIEYGKIGEEVLMLETDFADNDKSVCGHFLLIPDLDSYYILMTSLGIDTE